MNLLQRIKLDWSEYWEDQQVQWAKRRDARNIRRTIKQAKLNNLIDGKTYYIMRDPTGNPHAMRRIDIIAWKKAGIIAKSKTINDVLKTAIAIVDSNGVRFTNLEKK
jgi:hypothetical protein